MLVQEKYFKLCVIDVQELLIFGIPSLVKCQNDNLPMSIYYSLSHAIIT